MNQPMKTYLEKPTNNKAVARIEASYVANFHLRTTEVRQIEGGYIILFPNEKNKGTLIDTVDPK